MSETSMTESLLRPEAYPISECSERVSLEETHVSWLFLTGRFVYKVKKPVNYGFLDFSTIEKRRFYCQEELRLNRRFSPNVYLDVIEIQQNGEEFFFGAGNNTIDYAVKMRQLPKDRWLSQLVSKSQIDIHTTDRIAQRIAEMHLMAKTGDHIAEYGKPESLRINLQENFLQTRDFIGSVIDRAIYDVVRAYTEVFLQQNTGLFLRRQMAGFIRDCHGDLRLDQINIDHDIEFIDCIEFNERFRYSDVAADLAYLAMDLDSASQTDLSDRLVDTYVNLTSDTELKLLLNFYKCYRAYTRGKVICFQLENTDGGSGDRQDLEKQALQYMELAKKYAVPAQRILIITRGFMGSGKSTLAKSLGKRLNATVFSSDEVRKRLAGITPETHTRAQWNTGIYFGDHTRKTYQALHELARDEILNNGHVILDASYLDRQWCQQAYRVAADCNADFLVLETLCPEQIIKERLRQRENEGISVSDGRLELLDKQKVQFRDYHADIPGKYILIDTFQSLEDAVADALKEIYGCIFIPASTKLTPNRIVSSS